jgi:hypothetical protein
MIYPLSPPPPPLLSAGQRGGQRGKHGEESMAKYDTTQALLYTGTTIKKEDEVYDKTQYMYSCFVGVGKFE